MSTDVVTLPTGTTGRDEVCVWLEQTLDRLGALVATDAAGGAALIDRMALTEKLKAALDAVQAAAIVQFARSQVTAQRRLNVPPDRLGRGIAEQVALACKVGATEGSRRLHHARDLVLDMPKTLDMLAHGEISGWTARLITTETSHLDRATRRDVDTQLGVSKLPSRSPRAAAAAARRLAYRADPQAAADRCRKAREDRHVSLRPAPDTMAMLTGLLPVEQGVACWAALGAEANRLKASGDRRNRGQIMADTLVERLTGQTTAAAVPLEVQFVVPVEALVDPDHPAPADISGNGPIPAPLARQLLGTMDREHSGWRRLFTRPTWAEDRVVTGIDRRSRRFTGAVADLIVARDAHCRDPYCSAPIRHLDHIQRHSDGGATTPTNGRGVCESGNYAREMPGWSVQLIDPDRHTVLTTTPTGHAYFSAPPEPP
jgi:Domain of unknown function (DUF222)